MGLPGWGGQMTSVSSPLNGGRNGHGPHPRELAGSQVLYRVPLRGQLWELRTLALMKGKLMPRVGMLLAWLLPIRGRHGSVMIHLPKPDPGKTWDPCWRSWVWPASPAFLWCPGSNSGSATYKLCLSFPMWKTGIIRVPTPLGCYMDLGR